MNGDSDRTLSSRFELKYLLRDAQVAVVRDFIAPFTRPDPFAAGRSDLRYEISSLYFDTADLLLCNMTRQGIKNRFKLRVRCYSDDPATPVFLEVKRRMNKTILKHRARMARDEARSAITGVLAHVASGFAVSSVEAQEFVGLVAACAARPTCRVRYRREAYEAITGAPLRISLDHGIEHLETTTYDVAMDVPGWTSSQVPSVVLEVKYTDVFPTWLSDMVHLLGIQPLSVAKYVLSMNCIERERPLLAAPFASLPPLGPGIRRWIS